LLREVARPPLRPSKRDTDAAGNASTNSVFTQIEAFGNKNWAALLLGDLLPAGRLQLVLQQRLRPDPGRQLQPNQILRLARGKALRRDDDLPVDQTAAPPHGRQGRRISRAIYSS
jgi:hypothetical protein